MWVFYLLACGALCGVASAEGHRLPLSTLRLHSLHTMEEVGEVADVREKTATDLCLDSCLSLCACTFRAVREREDVQGPDVRSRERACPCLHRVGAGRHAAVFCRVSVGLFSFSVRGAVWRRVCGRSPPPGPKGATPTSALTARFARSRYAHTEEVTCPLALSSDSVSSRRLSVSFQHARHSGEPASG